ncbi:MAG TPA: condensation domain-containing protein, partial [Rhodospirillales bacterium]|nr:condensation domain-containing protein [Rhodospirillales bacterium]
LLRALCIDMAGDGARNPAPQIDEQWLALSMHHIICDGWSMANLAREVSVLYEALAQGRPSPLPPLPMQAIDVALWQTAWRDTPAGVAATSADIAFWQKQLAGAPQLQLPADRPPPYVDTSGGQVSISVPPTVAEALQRLCEQEGATLFMAGLTGFLAMLHRWTGQEDLVVGCPVAGRDRVELEPLIGFFVNAVVMRVDWSGDPAFRTAFARTRDTCLASFSHQHIPFEQVVEAVAPRRDASANPLFQAIFQWHAIAPDTLLPDVAGLPPPPPKFPLRCDLWCDAAGGIGGMIEYASGAFDRPTVEAMARGIAALLAAMARAPDRPVSEAPLLTPAEEQAALAQGRGPVVALPDAGRTHMRVAAIAAATPGRLAITDAGGGVSYGRLDGAANALARRLQAMGVGAGNCVAIAIDRPSTRIAAALATMKLGASYLPLDNGAPPARIAAILADAKPAAWITDSAPLPGEPPRIGVIADLPDTAEALPDALQPSDSIAYTVYTSGSTGQPL